MSQNYIFEYTAVEEGEQILEFELPTTKSDCTIIIDDPDIISFVGSQSTDVVQTTVQNETTVTIDVNSNFMEIGIPYGMSPDSANIELTPTRKRRRKLDNWQVTQRNKKYQEGLEFVNNKGQVRPRKEIKNLKNCLSVCKQRCATLISESERKIIFKEFYKLDQAGKYSFISMSTERTDTRRKRNYNKISRRKFSFFYFFNINGNRIPVCKQFYLGTLAISQKPIYTVYEKMNMSGTVSASKKGTNSSRAMDPATVDFIIHHISSFPCVDSHYCREKTRKKYLDGNLNVCKMFDLYSKKCLESNMIPVKVSYYRYIFNTRFNLEFLKPKSDRCGICELYKIDKARLQNNEYNEHINLKTSMRKLKDDDKQNKIPILCFDMQKVISCPKSNIDESFYLSKLNTYNLTAHLSTTKKVYCAIWNEATMGRTGNDIASALYKILERVCDENDITNLITWSDSCVPQNKNSFMAYAIQHFISLHPNIETIEMRFSTSGHSCIQEIDNAHSQIEKVLSKNEFFSPLGLIRLLKNINRNRPYQIIQMKPTNFFNFDLCAKNLNYKVVPFSALKMLRFCRNPLEVKYSLMYSSETYKEVSIRPPTKTTRNHGGQPKAAVVKATNPTVSLNHKCIPNNKKLDIQKMYKYMGQQDLDYYQIILAPSN